MTTNTKKKKSAREKRVLTASLIVAAVMVGGSTFAWFTSTDEVTNRLTAKGDFGVVGYETNFTPPESMTPGQTVDKDFYVVNTGNIDAFVKVSLAGTASGSYYAKTQTTAPTSGTATSGKYVEANASERVALQGGGRLVSAPTTTQTGTQYNSTTGKVETVALSTATVAKPVDVKTDFEPTTDGLYIFVRNETEVTPKYVGYYKLGSAYYQVDVTESSGTLTTKYITLVETESDDVTVALDYTNVKKDTPENTIPVTVTLDTGVVVKYTITLNDNWNTYWQYVDTKGFYYRDDLESGATSAQLIESVTMDADNQATYSSVTFDLNVKTESQQIIVDADGKEGVPGNSGVAADTGTVQGATASVARSTSDASTITGGNAGVKDGKEITSVSWS